MLSPRDKTTLSLNKVCTIRTCGCDKSKRESVLAFTVLTARGFNLLVSYKTFKLEACYVFALQKKQSAIPRQSVTPNANAFFRLPLSVIVNADRDTPNANYKTN